MAVMADKPKGLAPRSAHSRSRLPRRISTTCVQRIAATNWPTKELVDDRSQGVQLATMRELARYWTTEYDWRKCEARLNALPQFKTKIDGVDIHFIHVRSPHRNALPLIMTHGWPGWVIELLETVGPLTSPPAESPTLYPHPPYGGAKPWHTTCCRKSDTPETVRRVHARHAGMAGARRPPPPAPRPRHHASRRPPAGGGPGNGLERPGPALPARRGCPGLLSVDGPPTSRCSGSIPTDASGCSSLASPGPTPTSATRTSSRSPGPGVAAPSRWMTIPA